MRMCLPVIAAVLLLSACAERVETEVTRFHRIEVPDGQTVAIVPEDPDEVGRLEFGQYAAIIAEELRRIGYRPVDTLEAADLIATVAYEVGEPQTEIDVRWDGPYSSYWFRPGYFYPYLYGWYPAPHTFSRRIEAEQVYPRTLRINLIDDRRDEMVFQGRVYSLGEMRDISEVMPYLVTAMFTNFPGESGVTKLVTIKGDGLREPSELERFERG
ncbi:MAG: DUF4136 domain-containing protein [Rhodothalassiaceae bacterium]